MSQVKAWFPELLAASGEMAGRIRAFDWSQTPLGPIDAWPNSLRVAVGICLNSRFPMFVWWGPDLINIYNDAYIPVLGKRHPAGLGRSAPTIWGEIWPVIGPQADAVMQRGEATWNERVLLVMERHGYTEDTYFTWSYSPIPDESGGVGGLFCACTEETPRVLAERERDRLESALRESEEQYRTLFENAQDAIFLTDNDARYVGANPAAEKLTGYARDELLQKTVWDITPVPNRAAGNALWRAFLEAGRQGGEYALQLRDGSAVEVEYRAVANILPGLHLSVLRDISERKRAMDRISRLHSVAAALSEALTPAEVARVTVEQGVAALGASAGSLALLSDDGTHLEMAGSVGYPPEIIDPWRRTSMDAQIPMTDAVRRAEPVYLLSPQERIERYPTLAGVKARQETLASACVPLLVGGKPVGVLGLSFDQPGALAPDDKELMLSLTRQCAQALERARLFDAERHARAEAERSGRMKDEFLATLSHELRTPLTAILGWAQVLKTKSARLDQDVQQGLATIERNARVQGQLISDLLDMSRIISGKVKLDLRRIDLAGVVAAAIDSVRPSADAKDIPLQSTLDTTLPPITGDPNRLQQVVWNLLTNALKFTPKGGRVQVVLERVDSRAHIVVSDTGQGISRDFLPHVFERFRQQDATTTRTHGGMGLGLSIVKSLVEMHGGTVRADSGGVDKGSTFTVILPLPVVSVSERGGVKSAARDHKEPVEAPLATASLRGMKVLVIDDDRDSRDLIDRLLRDAEAEVTTAASVAEALDALSRHRPHVLVSDIGMPEKDGYDLIRMVRLLPPEQGGRIPAIALTAFARAGDRRQAVMAGFQVHLAKPVEPAELIAVIAGLAGLRSNPDR